MQRFDEDALRILRALRFSAQLSYDIDKNTCDAASKLAPTLSHVSAERIQTELLKLLVSPNPDRLMKAYEMGITRVILPELDECMKCPQNTPHHAYNVGEHLLVSCCNIAPVRHPRLSMLLHDIGKPLARTTDEIGRDHFVGHAALSSGLAEKILRRLKMDTATIRKVCNLVRFHDIMMNMVPDEKKVRKMLHVLGPENLDDLIAVKRADISAQSDYERERKLEAVKMIEEIGHKVIERGDCLSLKSLSVTGKDLMEAGIAPGKELGEILEAMLSDVLVTPSHNDRDYLMIHLKNYENHR
jgi:tRNA nucleotidyltransferase (CCA-adding enzyme)